VSGGQDLTAALDPAFGRAERFLVVDPGAGRVLQAIDNLAANAAHGAGIQAANLVGSTGAKAVISGGFGPKAVDGLRAQGVSMYETVGAMTALEALDLFRSGSLRPL
jgi:predicted Fe-Mo cluster-binding NifX family protein